MSKRLFAVQCEFCRRKTTDPSGRCADHRNMSASSIRKVNFGIGLTPKSQESKNSGSEGQPAEIILYLSAVDIRSDIEAGTTYELDITDGYGDDYDAIVSISDAGKPNEGMLAFATKRGSTIFFSPDEFLDVRIKDELALSR